MSNRTWSFIPWIMGRSTNSPAKKSDKETQSPMLRIFKEMIQRETPGARDQPLVTAKPEKAPEKVREKRKKKRKQYSSLHSQKSIDSSGVERVKKTTQYNVTEKNKIFGGDRTQSNYPFPSEKRDSWWVWDSCSKQKGSTSCSCASCQLKKIFSSEYSCIACLIFLFMISVFIAFFLVFKTIAMVPETPEVKETNFLDSHSLRNKLDSLAKGENLNRGQNRRGMRRSVWGDNLINNMESSFGEQETDDNFLKTNKLQKSNVRAESDLSSLLEPIRGDPHISPRLLKFYRKLMEADAQIKHLKQGINEKQSLHEYTDDNNLFRLKRSLFHSKKTKDKSKKVKEDPFPIKIYDEKDEEETLKSKDYINKGINDLKEKKINKDKNEQIIVKAKAKKVKRGRRHFNDSDDILYEKKRIVVQYLNEKPKFPKCTHCPQDSKSHEHKMKHPFYKNSQKLEELLDQFLDKNLNDVMPDEFGFKTMLEKPKKFKCQHRETTSTTKKQSTTKSKIELTSETTTLATTSTQKSTTNQNSFSLKAMTTDFYDKFLKPNLRKIMKSPIPKREDVPQKKIVVSNDGTIEFITETEPSYDIVLSVSTIINKQLDEDKNDYDRENAPKMLSRRLLQADDEEQEELVGYEDFKEVLSDEITAHDEMDRQVDRKRRQCPEEPKLTERPTVKSNPPGVYNQNWKGPVPLYPDEISSMMKQKEEAKAEAKAEAQRQNANKNAQYIDPSKHVKYHQEGLNDVDYVEDYLSDKYERLAKMAQAYSDYGVLADKKDVLKSEKSQDKGSKESVSAASVRVKKGSDKKAEEEGLAFQVKTDNEEQKSDEDPANIWKILTKHLRFGTDSNQKEYEATTLIPVRPGLGVKYTPSSKALNHFAGKKKGKMSILKPDELLIDFVMPNKVGRSLKSVSEADENEVPTPPVAKKRLPMDYLNKSEAVDEDKKLSKDPIIKIENKNSGNVKRTVTEDLEQLLTQLRETTETTKIVEFESFPLITSPSAVKNSPHFNNKVEKSLEHVTEVINAMKKSEFPNNEFDPGAFFGLISSWFNTLASVSLDPVASNQSVDAGNSLEAEKPDTETSNTEVNATKEILYPMYDSDMIENIGHRSRVLMSVDEDNADHKSVAEKQETVLEKSTDTLETTEPTSTLATLNRTEKINETKNQRNIQTNESEKDDKLENKTVVKRNAEEESKLVFWNDIYDDEYGIQVDPLDETMKDKSNSDIVKKSAVWIQNKVKKMSDSIKRKSKDSFNMIHNFHDDEDLPMLPSNEEFNKALHKISKRHNENDSDSPLDKKAGIAMLTAHMQEVCKRASHAVQQTRNKSQNKDPESEVASGLMQQLVKLMSELIDYEVHQKTCIKLPRDLRDFLDWLTRPPGPPPSKTQNLNVRNLKVNVPDENEPSIIPTTSPSEKEDVKLDVRSECLGTLIAVQDLIQEYSLLSEDDKSKMGGVREYLEDQLDFLHKQLNSNDEINLANIYAKSYMPYRFRRDVDSKPDNGQNRFKFDSLPNNRIKRKLGRFLKTYGKKHTRTTAGNYESLQVSTDYYNKKRSDSTELGQYRQETKMENKREIPTFFTVETTEKTKRNLKDVYYKAIADAKKITTMKNIFSNNKDFDSFDKGQNAMTM